MLSSLVVPPYRYNDTRSRIRQNCGRGKVPGLTARTWPHAKTPTGLTEHAIVEPFFCSEHNMHLLMTSSLSVYRVFILQKDWLGQINQAAEDENKAAKAPIKVTA